MRMEVASSPVRAGIRPAVRGSRRRRRETRAMLFALPATTLIFVFTILAMGVSLYVSFHQWSVLSPREPFVGLANYTHALHSALFWLAMRNTAIYVLTLVPLVLVAALGLALLVQRAWAKSIFRTIYYLPSVTPGVVLSFVWLWLFEPQGLINKLLGVFHLPQPNWLMNPSTALLAIVLTSAWSALGYYMVIYIAGLADIPADLYEAARLDGAGAWAQLRFITLPLLNNTTIFVLVISSITAFQVFTQVYLMTQGGPGNATEVINYLIFVQAFQLFHMGYAAAISWLLFAAIFVIVLIQMRLFISRQFY